MTPEERTKTIRDRLEQELEATNIQVIDDSQSHAGHIGAQQGAGHFRLSLASKQLQSLTKVQQHQKIYAILKDMMGDEIHALSIKVLPESEL